MAWAARFSNDKAIDAYLSIYGTVMRLSRGGQGAGTVLDERAQV